MKTPLVIALAALWPFVALTRAATFAEEVTRLAGPLVDASGTNGNRATGVSVVVVTRSSATVYGFGATRAGGATVPDGDTYFQMGSLSKPITGLILAAMIEASGGALHADDAGNALLADDVMLPDFAGQPITLAHLATHYGSLPNFPDNMTGPAISPAQNYSRAQLAAFLSGHTLGSAPGSAYLYSNLGYGVLGIALKDHAGAASYSALLAAQLTGPLGMTSTGLNEAPFTNSLGARLAQGYRMVDTALVETPLSGMGVLEGGGGIISTGSDVARLLRAFTGLTAALPPGAVERALASAGAGPGGTQTGYGLDIVTPASGPVRWEKAGLVAGYTAFMAFQREPAPGAVAILSNRGQHQAIVAVVRQLLALLIPPVVTVQMETADTIRVSFSAAARLSYDVQISPDLIAWTTATTLTNSLDAPTSLSTVLLRSGQWSFVRLRY